MKKKFLVLTLMVTLISVSIFARNQENSFRAEKQQNLSRVEKQQNLSRVEKQQNFSQVEKQQETPLYVKVGEDTYKNVKTNKIVLKDNLPETCKLLEDDFMQGNNKSNRDLNNRSLNEKLLDKNRNGYKERDLSNTSKRVGRYARRNKN